MVLFPDLHQPRISVFFVNRHQQRADRLVEHPFMHPAPCKRIQRKNHFDHREVGKVVVPAGLLRLLLRKRAWLAGLVQQNHHGLAQPLQNLHLGQQVAGVARVFG